MNNDERKFRISGIPENNEIEIPDEPKKSNSSSASRMKGFQMPNFENFSDEDIETIKKQLPKELSNFLNSSGIDFSNIFDQIGLMFGNVSDAQLNSILGAMGQSTGFSMCGDCDDCDDADDEETNLDNLFPTGQQKYLFADEFGSVECISSETLYDEFVEKYGTDSTLYLDDNIGIRDFLLNDLTAHLNFDDIKNMRFINNNQNFVLFYMEPKDPNNYGFYAAIIKKNEGSFALYVPTYCNTFDVIEGENGEPEDVRLFNREEDPYLFDGSASDITGFKFLAANLIEFAVSFALAPKNNVLLSPKMFGTIKNTRASISSDNSMIPIGRISSNGSINSTLLLKDAELPLDKEYYNLFMKFPTVVNDRFLRFLSGPLFEVDFNNCALLNNVELKYTHDGKLYFEVNHLDDF